MKQPFKLTNEGELTRAAEFEFWPWSLVTFTMESARYLIQSHNFCVPISEQVYRGIKDWSDPRNVVESSSLDNFVRITPSLQPGGSGESVSANLKSMRDSFELRQSIFGSQLNPIPLDDSHFGCWFICSARRADSAQDENAVLVMGYPPKFDEFDSAVGESFVASPHPLSSAEVEKIRDSKYEVAMGSEAVSLIDPEIQIELSLNPNFYHWDARGPMTILPEKVSPLPNGLANKRTLGLESRFYHSRF